MKHAPSKMFRLLPSIALGMAGCAGPSSPGSPSSPSSSETTSPAAQAASDNALVKIQGLNGDSTWGTLVLTSVSGGVRFEGRVEGLSPLGGHGFHIIDEGDCSAARSGSSAKHFNPGGGEHGDLKSPNSHGGDLGNLGPDEKGIAMLNFVKSGIDLSTGSLGIVGRAIVVGHVPDDLFSQPDGKTGPPKACGIITTF